MCALCTNFKRIFVWFFYCCGCYCSLVKLFDETDLANRNRLFNKFSPESSLLNSLETDVFARESFLCTLFFVCVCAKNAFITVNHIYHQVRFVLSSFRFRAIKNQLFFYDGHSHVENWKLFQMFKRNEIFEINKITAIL